ncbi:MAG: DNA/RNA non-specific endonuclease [Weissella confusa]|nr:DNA/RNA non-specific endonuclease [Weissella confusa]
MAIHRQAKLRRIVVVGSILGAGLVFYNRAKIVEQVFDTAGSSKTAPEIKSTVDTSIQQQLSELSYTGQQVQTVNNNQPFFTADELKTDNGAEQKLSRRDWLGRPQVADAMLNKSLMPSAKREPLTVRTPGYKVYRFNDNGREKYLYNRSHLIADQLTGLNNNSRNLITGTVALNATNSDDNQQSMEDFENQIAGYLRADSTHYVRYRVTPIYRNIERVPRGVQIEAQSVKDNAIRLNVYIFNGQPNWQINYYTGSAIHTN